MGLSIKSLHAWDVTPTQAVRIQESLRPLLVEAPLAPGIRLVAGVDVSYYKDDQRCFAWAVVWDLEARRPVEQTGHACPCPFPYVPGLLTFREGPAILQALAKLHHTPQAVIFDGQGRAHPRRMGVAAHLGLFLDLPTLGCAKTRLWGFHPQVGAEPGDYALLCRDGEVLGAVLRTRRKVKPVYVSPGHRLDWRGAVELVIRCGTGYRLPQPLRLAHLGANRMREQARPTNSSSAPGG